MTRLLANENVPGDAIVAARAASHDVMWIREVARGADDNSVLALALSEKRILLTFDKDFGEMVFRLGRTASCGIILARPRLRSSQYLTQFLLDVLSQSVEWEGHFSVAQEGRLRLIPL